MASISPCPHFVYELVDPRDNSIFYVGITINLYERFKQHMSCDGTNVLKDRRIREILVSGHLPIMRTLEQVPSFEQALEQEQYWIHQRLGSGLTNAQVHERKSPELFGKPGRNLTDKDHAYNVWLFQTFGDLLPNIWRNTAKFKSYVKHHPPKLVFMPDEGWKPNPKK